MTEKVYVPCRSIFREANERSIAEMMLAKVFERLVEGVECECKAPLKATFMSYGIMRVDKHGQARAAA